jgi:hypothetical protein
MPKKHEWNPIFSSWRHGGFYVDNLRYPNGACGCVSNNYPDKRWRIVCDPRGFGAGHTYNGRVSAARAEKELVDAMKASNEGAA